MKEIYTLRLASPRIRPYHRPTPMPYSGLAALLFTVCLSSHMAAEPIKTSGVSAAAQESITVSAGPKALPHPLEKEPYYRYCTRCHGLGKMKPFPASHNGYGSKTCLNCHQIAPTTLPEASSNLASRKPRPAAGRIPHSIESEDFTDCMKCHGLGKERPFPDSHAGYLQKSCLNCHKPAAAASAKTAADSKPRPGSSTAKRMPHSIEGETFKDCLRCHAQGEMKPFPAGHAGFSVNTCTSCHRP